MKTKIKYTHTLTDQIKLGEPFVYNQHKMTKAYGDIRFRFISCGFTPDEHNHMIYVKYKAHKNQTYDSNVKILSTDINHVHFDFPDREILITKNNFTLDGDRPFNSPFKKAGWHKAVSLTPMTSVADDLPFDRYMINPHAYTKNTEPKIRDKNTIYTSDKICLADCITGDSLLFTENGIMPIRKFVGSEVYDKEPYVGNVSVATPRTKLSIPSHVFRSPEKREIYIVRTKQGGILKCTGNHRLMTDKGWKKVKDITENDKIRRIFGANIWSNKNVKFYPFTAGDYAEEKFAHYPDEIICHICGGSYQQIDSHLSAKHKINVSEVRNVYPFTKSREVATRHSRKKVNKDFVLPTEMSPELAELLGMIIADGQIGGKSIKCFFGVKKHMAYRAKELFLKIFNLKVKFKKLKSENYRQYNSVKATPGLIYYTVSTRESKYLMKFFHNIGLKKAKTKDKQIPWSVLESKKECVIAFLSGLYSTDGYVDKAGMPHIYTASRQLGKQIMSVLMNLGIVAKCKHKYLIAYPTKFGANQAKEIRKGYGCPIGIWGRKSGAVFNQIIKLTDPKKRKRQNKLIKLSNHHSAIDFQGKVTYTNKKCTKGFLYSEVVSVLKSKKKAIVYDITTSDEYHEYITDYGIHSHNSSAFQLGHGFLQFIDPVELCGFYYRNADEGVVLDIPTRHLSDKISILKHTAKLQNLNTRYMKKIMFEKYKRTDFRFATVFHGLSMESLEYFRNKIESFDDDFPIVCISGAMRFNILESIHRMLKIILVGKQYPQYHLLGVGHPVLLVLVIWMAYLLKKSNQHVLITSDASSAIMLSAAHTYFSQNVFHDGLNLTRFGLKMDTNKDAPAGEYPNPYRRIQALDPISEIVGGYQDIISSYNIAATRTYIKYVNQMSMLRYFNLMCHYANTTDHKTYKALILEQYKRSTHVQLLSVAMDYLRMVFEGGMNEKSLNKAYNKYKFYMPAFSGEQTLHSFPRLQDEEETEESSFLKKKHKFIKQHLITVINNYYEFHRSGKRPESYVNLEKKEFDVSNAMRK